MEREAEQLPDILSANHQPERVSLRGYVNGFILCLFLTLSAYFLVRSSSLSRPYELGLLSALALIQFVVQLFFFLHVGREFSPKMKLMMTLFMILVVLILVVGSLWIMSNLSQRVMTVQQMTKYMNDQDGL